MACCYVCARLSPYLVLVNLFFVSILTFGMSSVKHVLVGSPAACSIFAPNVALSALLVPLLALGRLLRLYPEAQSNLLEAT